MKRIHIALVASIVATSVNASELTHGFQSPAFIPGNGYSQHVLSIIQMENVATEKNQAKADAAIAKAEAAAKSTNLAKFLVNVEARIYAQLSKQLADQLFAEGGGDNGTMNFQGTTISWVKTASDVKLTIIEASGGTTNITVPIASFAF